MGSVEQILPKSIFEASYLGKVEVIQVEHFWSG